MPLAAARDIGYPNGPAYFSRALSLALACDAFPQAGPAGDKASASYKGCSEHAACPLKGPVSAPYFNSGVMLLHLPSLAKCQERIDRLLCIFGKGGPGEGMLTYADQDIFNLLISAVPVAESAGCAIASHGGSIAGGGHEDGLGWLPLDLHWNVQVSPQVYHIYMLYLRI